MKIKYRVGDKVGRLTIKEFLDTDYAKKRLVKCICECSEEIIIRLNNLGRKTNSCGCLKADLIKERMGRPIEHLATVSILNVGKRHTRDTDLEFADVYKLIFNNCFYCEMGHDVVGTIYRRAIDDGRSVKSVGVDRIDSEQGYYKNNVVSCCYSCNKLKSNHPTNIFIDKLEKFIKNLKILSKRK